MVSHGGWLLALIASLATATHASVSDSIAMVSVGSPLAPPGEWPALRSPDNAHDVLLLYSGDVAGDVNRYSVMLFDRHEGRSQFAPRRLLTITSSDKSGVGISALHWLDAQNLLALVTGSDGKTQIVRIPIGGGNRSTLTDATDGAVDFASDRTGTEFATIEPAERSLVAPQPSTFAGRVVLNETPYALLEGREPQSDPRGFGGGNVVVVRTSGGFQPVELPAGEWPLAGMGLSMSPSGRYVVVPVAMMRSSAPSTWLSRTSLPASWVFLYGLRLFDRETKRLSWLLDEPTMYELSSAPVWSRNERQLFISNRWQRGSADAEATASAVVEIGTGRILASRAGRLVDVSGATDITKVRLADVKDVHRQYCITAPVPAFRRCAPEGSGIRLVQSMASPPRLVDHVYRSGRERDLLALNPSLKVNDLGQVSNYEWTLADGRRAGAGLYLPPSYRVGTRYPLVIQTHGWDASRFWYDGPSTAGFAARSLAEEGFVVVQIGGLPQMVPPTRRTAAYTDMIDSLVGSLDAQGLIDPGRLGITAWSISGSLVRDALTFSKYHFGAAVLVDSRDDGFMSYLLSDRSQQEDLDATMGARPYGAGLDAWRRNSAMFNIDRVSTPVRLVELGPLILSQWEQWASMKRLGRPIDFIWLPASNHWPVRPSERMEVQQGAVDWYRFWLQGIIDGEAKKAAQYGRWMEIRRGCASHCSVFHSAGS